MWQGWKMCGSTAGRKSFPKITGRDFLDHDTYYWYFSFILYRSQAKRIRRNVSWNVILYQKKTPQKYSSINFPAIFTLKSFALFCMAYTNRPVIHRLHPTQNSKGVHANRHSHIFQFELTLALLQENSWQYMHTVLSKHVRKF